MTDRPPADDAAAHLAELENALADLLDALIEHRERRAEAASRQPVPIAATPLETFCAADIPKNIPKRDTAAADRRPLARDPVGWALRRGVTQIGRYIFDVAGSTEVMRDALERVAERRPEHYSRRGSIIDHAWNSIGSDRDRWWS